MRRLRNKRTGVIVRVRDDKPMGHEWEPVDGSHSAYDDMTVAELKDEIRGRNEGRDEDDRILLTGSKADLVAALEADD